MTYWSKIASGTHPSHLRPPLAVTHCEHVGEPYIATELPHNEDDIIIHIFVLAQYWRVMTVRQTEMLHPIQQHLALRRAAMNLCRRICV